MVYGWRGQSNETRIYDAGEPSGTAGRPILSIVESYNLYNTAVIIARYFGGVKLGKGGLSRGKIMRLDIYYISYITESCIHLYTAFFQCALETIQQCDLVDLQDRKVLNLYCSPKEAVLVQSFIKQSPVSEILLVKQTWMNDGIGCTLEVSVVTGGALELSFMSYLNSNRIRCS